MRRGLEQVTWGSLSFLPGQTFRAPVLVSSRPSFLKFAVEATPTGSSASLPRWPQGTEVKPPFHVAVPSLPMRGGWEDGLDLRQGTSIAHPHKTGAWGERPGGGSGALSWWTLNDVQAATTEVKQSTELRNWATVSLTVVMLGSAHHARLTLPF